MNIRKMLEAGQAELNRQHQELEETKRGVLRAGNSGAVTEDGAVLGKCARITLARFLGHQAPTPAQRQLMFAAGIGNEDIWDKVLSATGYEGVILREEEIPVRWTVPGTTIEVSGRPDFVLADDQRNPLVVLELKLVSSYYTAMGVKYGTDPKPKTDHLCQAAHYCWQLGVPGKICYSSRVDWHVSTWDKKKFEPDVPGVEYNARGEAKKIYPFYQIFDVRIGDGGVVEYSVEGADEWKQTLITQQGIVEYYKLVTEMAEKRKLGPRPSGLEASGHKAYFDQCDPQYCDFALACDRFEDRSFDEWLDAIRLISQGHKLS
jgi:hypothetical protein